MDTTTLEVTGIARKSMTQLASKAKNLGTTPQDYVRQLVEADLELDRKAKTTTLRALMGRGRRVDEAELDKLVDAARTITIAHAAKVEPCQHRMVLSSTPTFFSGAFWICSRPQAECLMHAIAVLHCCCLSPNCAVDLEVDFRNPVEKVQPATPSSQLLIIREFLCKTVCLADQAKVHIGYG